MRSTNRRKNMFRISQRRQHRNFLILLILVSLLSLIIIFNPRINSTLAKNKSGPDIIELPPLLLKLPPGMFQDELDWLAETRIIRSVMKKNQTFTGVLHSMGVDNLQAYELTRAAADVLDLRKVRPGAEIILNLRGENNVPVRLEFNQNHGQRVIIVKTLTGYAATLQKYEPLVSLKASEGEIKYSLWGSAVERYNLDPEIVLNFSDIFAYDIDFFTDIQKGDSFRILYELKYLRGHPMGTGRILVAEFVNKGKKLEAYYFKKSTGKGGFYDSKGRSLRKMFLKSPLRYRRISSYFSRSRFHPILKKYRPHLGIDYAARSGTPVETVAGGRVTFMARDGGFGRLVKIKHNRTYTTYYGHLSRYAKGLKKGKRVKQGDLIGYVGSSGLSTGPHLDYRMARNGKFINPLALKLNPAPPIEVSQRSRFLGHVEDLRSQMVEQLAKLN